MRSVKDEPSRCCLIARGYYGAYGGRFVPEVLIPALDELEAAFGAGPE